MVGLQYDFVANPLGVVRLSFEKAAISLPSDSDPAAVFRGKDWGAVDLFREFLFEQGGLTQVPVIDALNMQWIQPNSLVRFRGMVQDMFGNELYVGAFKDGTTWRTNKFADFSSFAIPPGCEAQLWERHLFHCIPVPGLNSWTLDSSPPEIHRTVLSSSVSRYGEKRRRDGDVDAVEALNNADGDASSCSKKQKEDYYPLSPNTSMELANHVDISESQSKDHNFSADPFSCLVKIYDMPENQLKLNDVVEFIGIYTFDPQLVNHNDDSDDIMTDLIEDVTTQLPPSKVPRLHCLVCRKLSAKDFLSTSHVVEPLPSTLRGIRESLLAHFCLILGNDGLAAQCLLLHLLSQLHSKVDVVTVGRLALNFTGFTRETASVFGNQLNSALQSLLPYTQAIPLTVEFLNAQTLQPRKDNQTGRLVMAVLQLAQGTHLTFDETHMQPGVLNSKGVENARSLKHLMEWQTVEYDFEYYKLEMAADVQLLVLSEGKSNILPADLVVPFRPATVSVATARPEDLQAWRWYLATVRSLRRCGEPDMFEKLQDEMVSTMCEDRSLGCTDLSRMLTMAQLMSASLGEKSLSLEHWQMVKELERLRNERLK